MKWQPKRTSNNFYFLEKYSTSLAYWLNGCSCILLLVYTRKTKNNLHHIRSVRCDWMTKSLPLRLQPFDDTWNMASSLCLSCAYNGKNIQYTRAQHDTRPLHSCLNTAFVLLCWSECTELMHTYSQFAFFRRHPTQMHKAISADFDCVK